MVEEKQSQDVQVLGEVSIAKHTSKITDAMVAELRSQIGKEISKPLEDWEIEELKFRTASILRLCKAIGDFNPLFSDIEYAKKSRSGKQIVPPGIILELEQLDPEREGLIGCRAILQTASLEWDIPILLGDELQGKTLVRDVRDVPSPSDGGIVVSQEYETIVTKRTGDKVGSVRTSWYSYERGSAAELSICGGRELFNYSRDYIESIHQEYMREEERGVIRGAQPRYWEEVGIGDELPYIIKGPTTSTRRVSYTFPMVGMGGGPIGEWYHGFGEGYEQHEKWPALFLINENGTPEPVESVEWWNERAQKFLGLPGAIEANSERLQWTVQLLTNWQGDSGFLRKLELEFPKINLLGDISRCYGKIKGKRVEEGKHVVEIEVWNTNQVGDRVTTGSAEVILPSKT